VRFVTGSVERISDGGVRSLMTSNEPVSTAASHSLSVLDQEAAQSRRRGGAWWWRDTATPVWRACRNKRRIPTEVPEDWFSWEEQLGNNGEWAIIPGSTKAHRIRKEAQESQQQRREPKAESALDKLFGQRTDTD